ncbi:MAG: methyltransferase domain-containing protein [Planctomycetia bacterium]|nr:methyltransferase domain-containing protein [Planctomycetia bacterium]
MKVFSDYAQYYDLLNQQKDYTQEVDYIISLLNKFAPDASNLLELGCGTGLHAINLADKGYHITGVDQSQDMIYIAQERLKTLPSSISNLINFNIGDIRTHSINKSFDVALSLFHVVSYQVTNNDLNQSFDTVSKHLKPGGIFIFDCWYGPAVISDKPFKRTKNFENDKLIINRTATPHIHAKKNQVDVHFDIKITNKQTRKSEYINEIHKMRYLFNPEIELFLKVNNLKLLHSEEWLTGNEPDFNSWYVTFICERI